MKKIITSCSIFFIVSCSNNSVNFKLKNSSYNKIDSLIITNNFDSIKINNLIVNSEIFKELKFLKEQPKNDGNFRIIIYKNRTIQDTTFGYFSNGIPLNKEIYVEIKEMGLQIKTD